SEGFRYRLRHNKYFETMKQRGYALRIYQPNYVDLCPFDTNGVACHTYDAGDIASFRDLKLSVSEKARLVAGTFLSRSKTLREISNTYVRLSEVLDTMSIRLTWMDWYQSPTTLNSIVEIERITRDLATAKEGELFVAHLLVPHSPFMYSTTCAALPVRLWVNPHHLDSPGGVDRTAAYASYGSQVRCTMQLIDGVLSAIPGALRERAIVIVNGDHGSRLSPNEPTAVDAASMSGDDYSDNYSTLFAVRAPGLEAIYDKRMTPITCILQTLVAQEFQSVAGIEKCSGAQTVFMKTGANPVPKPLPSFVRDDQ
ncbi:MAG: hypothetical protein ACRD2N_25230, partial [Vicinamibacterales bacterium]